MSEQEIKLGYLKKRPQTDVENLRTGLEQLDRLVGSLRYLDAGQARKIPALFDQVHEGFQLVNSSGMDLKGERTQWELIGANFENQAASFIRVLGGVEALRRLRSARQASQDRWWWYPDRVLASRRKSLALRVIFWLGLAAVFVAGMAALYQHFLAPDEATQTSLSHSFAAENLADQGEYQAAYVEIQQAIEAKPGQADLYLLKGVLAEILGMQTEATQAYQQAEAASQNQATFLIAKANEYLRFGRYDQAIDDATSALQLDPQQAPAYLILGQASEGKGDYQSALTNYRKADELATEQNDAQLQVIARMSIGQLYNKLPAVAPTDDPSSTPMT